MFHSDTRPVLLAGLGVTGRAVRDYLKTIGKELVIVDDAQDRSVLTFEQLISQYVPGSFSFGVVSPGFPPHHRVTQWMAAGGMVITSELEMAISALQEHKAPNFPHFFAITGTNGKTTVTELTTHLLNHVGLKAAAYGNIGAPLIRLAERVYTEGPSALYDHDAYVLEVSSYQIEGLTTPFFTGCAWLNIAPDHLEWHGSFEKYRKAKERLLSLVVPSKRAVALLHTSLKEIAVPPHVTGIWYGVEDAEKIPSTLQGEHVPFFDKENYLAAAGLVHSLGIEYEKIAPGYDSFLKGPHRIQHVKTVHNISFYDDSKGTNIHAVLAAVKALKGPIILIAGGVHKGHPYTEWAEAFPEKVQEVFVIGQAAKVIEQDLKHSVTVTFVGDLRAAVEQSFKSALSLSPERKQVTILLSPGCSSFDMFRDYKDRGEKFQQYVEEVTSFSFLT